MKSKILGYIVVDGDGTPMHAAIDMGEKLATLWRGHYVTMFASRAAARRAIRRTLQYAAKNRYAWPWMAYPVVWPIEESQ
jgi:hypothetical protein